VSTERIPPSERYGLGTGTATAVVGVLIGVVMLVIGLVTLARTGLPQEWPGDIVVVGAFTRTTVMGLIETFLGIAMIAVGTKRDARTLLAVGLVAAILGIVWLIEPGAFEGLLGITRSTGWLYLLMGGTALAVGALDRPRERVVRV
jgi:hypothetical protein